MIEIYSVYVTILSGLAFYWAYCVYFIWPEKVAGKISFPSVFLVGAHKTTLAAEEPATDPPRPINSTAWF